MRIGFVSLGKLALPMAVVMDAAGHDVVGTDVNSDIKGYLEARQVPYKEEGLDGLLRGHDVKWLDSASEVVAYSDVIFLAPQTPHSPQFDGCTPLEDEPKDFEYAYLANAFRAVASAALEQRKVVIVGIVSTVLPGTVNRVIRPALNGYVKIAYCPSFIAMGTTVRNLREPEFLLLGVDDPDAADWMEEVFSLVHDAPIFRCSIETAELSKVAYNSYLGLKIVFANTMMEYCHHTGANVDDVAEVLSLATDRLMSAKYMRGGMGDGGGCHPRDHYAMSWLAKRLGLSFDIFGTVMEAREKQTQWLADLALGWQEMTKLPIVILGKAYKPETNLTFGSCGLLLFNLLMERTGNLEIRDHYVDGGNAIPPRPAVFVVATNHPDYQAAEFPRGSVVIDPWGYIPDAEGVTVIRVGRN